MRFLVDRCAGHKLAVWLRTQGHDVTEARELGRDPGDRSILQLAASLHGVLVTIDKDFGQFIFLEHAPHCGLVRLPDVPVPERIRSMQQVLQKCEGQDWEHLVVTVRGERIRITRSPS